MTKRDDDIIYKPPKRQKGTGRKRPKATKRRRKVSDTTLGAGLDKKAKAAARDDKLARWNFLEIKRAYEFAKDQNAKNAPALTSVDKVRQYACRTIQDLKARRINYRTSDAVCRLLRVVIDSLQIDDYESLRKEVIN